MTPHRHHRAAALVALLLLAGCAAPTVTGEDGGDPALERLAAAGEWTTLAAARVSCASGSGDGCAKAYASKGDACLRLAIQQPPGASDKDAQLRELLDCAEDNYRKALVKQTSKATPAGQSIHGGLLLTLSERRNRLDDMAKEKKLDRENEKLMMAAQDARREAAGSALGYLYGASAHAYRAMLKPAGGDRCPDLRTAEMLLQRSPTPPPQLVEEQQRLNGLVGKQLRASGCPRISRR